MAPSYKVGGTVAGGFEPVKEEFVKLFEQGREDCSQLCVFRGQEKVSCNIVKLKPNKYIDCFIVLNRLLTCGVLLMETSLTVLILDKSSSVLRNL